jgi:hypothetical protein
MPVSRKIDDVLASARKDIRGHLRGVRGEIARLGGEERALTRALASLKGDSARASASRPADASTARATAKRSTRRTAGSKAGAGRRRRSRGASKSTAERVEELRALLAGGPKSRSDLAAALKVSPARVQQLLAELGSTVSSQPDPAQRRGKLWSLAGNGNRADATKTAAKRNATSTRPAARKRTAR